MQSSNRLFQSKSNEGAGRPLNGSTGSCNTGDTAAPVTGGKVSQAYGGRVWMWSSFKQLSARHLREHELDGRSYRVKYGILVRNRSSQRITLERKEIVQSREPWRRHQRFSGTGGEAAGESCGSTKEKDGETKA